MAGIKDRKELNAYFNQVDFRVEILGQAEIKIPEVQNKNNLAEDEDNLEMWLGRFKADKYKTLFRLGFLVEKDWFSPSMRFLYNISTMVIDRLSKQPDIELSRDLVQLEPGVDDVLAIKENLPFSIGMEYVDEIWIGSLWVRLLDIFRTEIKEYEGTVNMFFTEHNSNINVVGRVFFHLVENKAGEYPFAFMATYSTKPPKSKKTVHTPLKNALVEFKEDQKRLLSLLATVTKASEVSTFISKLMESGELFSPLRFTANEAYTFLSEIEIYEKAGIMCRIPNWWRRKSNSFKISVKVGEKEPSAMGLDAIMDFSPSLIMNGEEISETELKEFLKMSEGLINYKGKWIEINKERLREVLDAFNKAKNTAKNREISLGEAMRMELKIDKTLENYGDDVEVSVSNGRWLKDKIESLTNPEVEKGLELSPSFHADLRTYQEKGFLWLHMMSQMGFGACLADDMGLGKTVQVIAFLEHIRVTYGGKALLILPASLIGNWQKEIEKFAPELSYEILHKTAGNKKEITISESSFLYITTYGMAIRLEELRDKEWDILILDEAQAIKNPGTKQTKNVKLIPAKMKIAMTGTPIENRLSDLWSLFDFLNQGFLGTAKEFTGFTKELMENNMGYARLRKMIQPFILRRLKTDKAIIADLPDKIEINEYTSLSKRQVGLYEKLIHQIMKDLETSEGIQRRGIVLSSIMKFKQICNHPDLYLGLEEFKAIHSGKLEKLEEICEIIYEKREKVLIFTQFKEMTEPLSSFLEGIFFRKGLVLHGGTPIKARTEMVDEFNSDEYVPYMILSLKAGGVGLNLTSANHVIHFDRWWNPAVENQATDRAFRIGQTKNVMVHKFVTKGTIEEKIDEMITKKQKLAGDILMDSGEKWITELDNEELMELFTLGGGK